MKKKSGEEEIILSLARKENKSFFTGVKNKKGENEGKRMRANIGKSVRVTICKEIVGR